MPYINIECFQCGVETDQSPCKNCGYNLCGDKEEGFVLVVPRDFPIFKNRATTLTEIKDGGEINVLKTIIPDSMILCDGCNKKMEEEKIPLIIFPRSSRLSIYGTRCQECIDRYYSSYNVFP